MTFAGVYSAILAWACIVSGFWIYLALATPWLWPVAGLSVASVWILARARPGK